jgi:homoserine dehydrogenase
MEASVAGGIPIHAVRARHLGRSRHHALRHSERNVQLYPHRDRAARRGFARSGGAQAAGYAGTDPSADVDGLDALKLAILSALAFGERIVPSDIFH